MSSNESRNPPRNLVKNVEVHEISLKMFEAALRELDKRGIHPKTYTDVITLAILNLVNCLDQEKQQFSFEELDSDEPEEVQHDDSTSQSVASDSFPSTSGTPIGTSTDLHGNGVTRSVSATGQGVHTRFLYSKPVASHAASTSVSVPLTSKSKRVDKGKGKADNSDSGYESTRNSMSNPKKRAHEDDDVRVVRNVCKRSNKPKSVPDPGPSRLYAHPRSLHRESTFYALCPDEEVRDGSDSVKLSTDSKRSRVLETSSASTLTSSISSPVASFSAVASTSIIVRAPSPASSVASNATPIYSPPAESKTTQPILSSRPRPRGLRREYAFYISRTDTSSSSTSASPAISSTSTSNTSASAFSPVASTSVVAFASPLIHPPSPAASIASNGTIIFSPPASPVFDPTAPSTVPSLMVGPSPHRTSKRDRGNDSDTKTLTSPPEV
ncbi:hypothetical protein J132_08194 [Termitomyces sp. J132]|nr:hypothetical protein H2248_001979 [Termitomyces sp. 'cryptogamus']KNZ78969.1 hypothetical protein J132_08194 [Termitomyces sp. J132]